MFDSDHSFCIDQCGKVDQISEHAAVLIPFYFLPIIILFGLVGKEVATKVKRLHLCNSRLVAHIQFKHVSSLVSDWNSLSRDIVQLPNILSKLYLIKIESISYIVQDRLDFFTVC